MAADKHVKENGKVYRWYWLQKDGSKRYYPQLYTSLTGVKLGTRYWERNNIYVEVCDNWQPVDMKW